MSRINWTAPEGRFFDTGLDRGVLYPKGTPPVGPVLAKNLSTVMGFELGSPGQVLEYNLAPNPAMVTGTATVDVATNYIADPRFNTLANWGSTGGGATTLTNMGDGRLRQSYAATGGPFLAQLAPPNAEVAATQGQSMTVKFGYQGPGGAQVVIHHRDASDNIVDQTVYNLPNSPGAEVQISVTATVTASSVTHLFLAQIAYNGVASMPAGSVHYFRGVIWTKDPSVSFFTGSTAAANDMVYAWSGAVDNSPSVMRGTAVSNYAGSSSYAIKRTSWAVSGTHSMEVRASGTSADSYADAGNLGLIAGRTYTFSVTYNTPVALSGSMNSRARKIVVFHRIGAGGYTEIQSPAAPTTGVGRVAVTASIPAGTTEVLVRLYNGSPTPGQSVFVDNFLVMEAPVEMPYFDGSTAPGDDFTYAWAGTANASTSRKLYTIVNGTSPPGAALGIQSTSWSSSGTKSLRLYSQYSLPGSAYLDIGGMAPEWGKAYTVRVKIRVREELQNAPGVVFLTTGLTPANQYAGSYVPLNAQGRVTPGVYEVKLTTPLPAFNSGAQKYLRLINNNPYGVSVWFDDLLIVEGDGKDVNGDEIKFFDGDTTDTGAHTYYWNAADVGTYKTSFKQEQLSLAVPWMGLQSVDEEGGESAAAYYVDGRPFLFLPRPKEFKANLKAVTYPDAFSEIMGLAEVTDGMYLDSQPGASFDLAYRTLVGNALEGVDHGYKIHLVYNATVSPQALTYESMGNSINPTSFSWEIQAVPVVVEGFRPTAHIIIDTRHMDPKKVEEVEAWLYGSDDEVPHMPTPQSIFDLLQFGDTIVVTDNGDGSFDVTGSYENVYMVGDGIFRVDNIDGQDNGDGTFTISTTEE